MFIVTEYAALRKCGYNDNTLTEKGVMDIDLDKVPVD